MARFGAIAAANLLNDFVSETDPPRHVEKIIVAIIVAYDAAGDQDPSELAESWAQTVLRKASELQAEASKRRAPLNFEFNAADEEHIQGRLYINGSDPPELKASKLNRIPAKNIESILPELDPARFEKLCAIVLEKLGCPNPAVSTQSNDQGIDFFGSIPLGSILKATTLPDSVEESLSVWVFGQAKRYNKSIVKTAELREIVGSVELAKARAYSSLNHSLSDTIIRACDPVFYMFITSGDFTTGGHTLIDNSGVIAMDRKQLAAFLADHKVGIIKGEFSKARFLDVIDQVSYRQHPQDEVD